MPNPVWRGTVELRWVGNILLVGNLTAGEVYHNFPAAEWCAMKSDDKPTTHHPTKSAAQSALVDAVAKALAGIPE